MQLSEVIEILDSKISGGSEYLWTCYGLNSRYLDFESDFAHASVIFDTKNQIVYSAEVTDKDGEYAYRWLNPEYKKAYQTECKEKNIRPNEAWDTTDWVDLELADDFLEKATAIFHGEKFDTRVDMPLTLDDDTLLQLFKMAHDRDVTLNKMVEIILQEVIDRHKETV